MHWRFRRPRTSLGRWVSWPTVSATGVRSPSHPAQRIGFMKAAQVGATEAGNNWIGFVIHHAPGPMLAVLPTVEMARRGRVGEVRAGGSRLSRTKKAQICTSVSLQPHKPKD